MSFIPAGQRLHDGFGQHRAQHSRQRRLEHRARMARQAMFAEDRRAGHRLTRTLGGKEGLVERLSFRFRHSGHGPRPPAAARPLSS
jgi:hypothetical protein